MRPGPRMRLKAESTGGAATALAGGMGSAVIPPAGSRAEPRPPTGFPLFSAHIDGP